MPPGPALPSRSRFSFGNNNNSVSTTTMTSIYNDTYISGTPGIPFPKTTDILNIENLEQRKLIINNHRVVIIDYYSNNSIASKVLKEQSSFIYKDYEIKG